MAVDDMDAVGGALDLQKKRAVNPWVFVAAVLFVFAFLLGWRSAGPKDA